MPVCGTNDDKDGATNDNDDADAQYLVKTCRRSAAFDAIIFVVFKSLLLLVQQTTAGGI